MPRLRMGGAIPPLPLFSFLDRVKNFSFATDLFVFRRRVKYDALV
jgi:hypothetical protein